MLLGMTKPSDHRAVLSVTGAARARAWAWESLLLGLLGAGVGVFGGGCASAPAQPAEEVRSKEAGAQGDSDEAREAADRARKAEVLQRKIDIATFEFAGAARDLGQALAVAKAELALAEAALATFQQYERMDRQAESELELQGVRDRAQEAAEELAQLEVMYREQDLDDRTREFVLSRGRRDAQRAQQRIQLAERAHERLVREDLPREETKLRLEVDQARAALAAAEHAEALDQRQRTLDLDELRYELEQVAEELRAAEVAAQGKAGRSSGRGRR